MSYTILNTDGSTLLLLADGTVDSEATSLDLVGRNVTPYGQYLNNNLVKMLANSASTAGSPPRSPLTGQIWYDTTSKRLKVYDGTFTTVSGAIVSATQPDTLIEGDLWFDTTNKQINVYDGTNTLVIGPATPSTLGEIGWVLPTNPIHDINNNTQNVILLKSYGKFIGIASSQAFNMSSSDSTNYFNTSTMKVVSGLTVLGDISNTGQNSNKYFSVSIDMDRINLNSDPTYNNDVTSKDGYVQQNSYISTILGVMFPLTASTSTYDVGVPIGSEARVLCTYTRAMGRSNLGTQFRRFKATQITPTIANWTPYEVYSYRAAPYGTFTNMVNVIPLSNLA